MLSPPWMCRSLLIDGRLFSSIETLRNKCSDTEETYIMKLQWRQRTSPQTWLIVKLYCNCTVSAAVCCIHFYVCTSSCCSWSHMKPVSFFRNDIWSINLFLYMMGSVADCTWYNLIKTRFLFLQAIFRAAMKGKLIANCPLPPERIPKYELLYKNL
jgi:hypothetical protein